MDASEAILGYRLRQHHVGVVSWLADSEPEGHTLTRLEQATLQLADESECEGRPIFLPQDESCAWVWLPLGAKDAFTVRTERRAAWGRIRDPVRVRRGRRGDSRLRRTNLQALGAKAVSLAAGPSGQRLTNFPDVAPLALMVGSVDLLQA